MHILLSIQSVTDPLIHSSLFSRCSHVFASKPHFLDADPDYLKNVTGLHPNRSIHDSYLVIEPVRTTVNIYTSIGDTVVLTTT